MSGFTSVQLAVAPDEHATSLPLAFSHIGCDGAVPAAHTCSPATATTAARDSVETCESPALLRLAIWPAHGSAAYTVPSSGDAAMSAIASDSGVVVSDFGGLSIDAVTICDVPEH